MTEFKEQIMLGEYTRFERGDLTVEVNWDEESKPCKLIKFTIDGKSAVVPNGDFYTMMMIFGTPEQQEKLIPVRETKVMMVTSRIKSIAKKNIKKGEPIIMYHTYPVAKEIYEKIQLEGGSGNEKLDRDVLKLDAVKNSGKINDHKYA